MDSNKQPRKDVRTNEPDDVPTTQPETPHAEDPKTNQTQDKDHVDESR